MPCNSPVATETLKVSNSNPVLHRRVLLQGGPFKYSTPRALEEAEIPAIIEAYAAGAKNALEAGFDGVEVGAACGHWWQPVWAADGADT